MPKIKISDAQWERARTLFELGKSLSEIQKATGIDRSQISKKANEKEWKKGFLQQIATDKALILEEKFKVESTISTLAPQQQRAVDIESHRILQGKEWYAKAARKVALKTVDSLGGFVEGKDFKSAADALVACMKAESLVPYYPTPTSAVKVDVNTEKNEISPQLKSAASIIES